VITVRIKVPTYFDSLAWADGLCVEWTPFHQLWLAVADPGSAEDLFCCGCVPMVPARGFDFSGLDLSGAYLCHMDLSGSNFANCRLKETDFTCSELRYTRWRGAIGWRTRFERAQLLGANFDGATLFEPDFARAQMCGTVLRGASIADAKFTGADLEGVCLI